MASKFDDFESSRELSLTDWENENLTPDCFELLSAYLDEEVTPQERQQVQYWLDNDPKIKQIYNKLRQLHCECENLSVPSEQITADLSVKIFQTLDRSRRKRRVLYWGGSAVAALFLAFISSLTSGESFLGLKMAKSIQKNSSEPLMVAVAVNKPTVKIPKASVSSPHLTEHK